MQIPFTNDAVLLDSVRHKPDLGYPRAGKLLWEKHGETHGEKHGVWVVEGTLRRRESNVLERRCLYPDDDPWLILMGDGYDRAGTLVKSPRHLPSNVGRRPCATRSNTKHFRTKMSSELGLLATTPPFPANNRACRVSETI